LSFLTRFMGTDRRGTTGQRRVDPRHLVVQVCRHRGRHAAVVRLQYEAGDGLEGRDLAVGVVVPLEALLEFLDEVHGVVAISSSKFAVIAGDTRQSSGYNIETRTAKRVFQLTPEIRLSRLVRVDALRGVVSGEGGRTRRGHSPRTG
jgi:hypothetical protein